VLPTQRADRQVFPRAPGNADPAAVSQSEDEALSTLTRAHRNAIARRIMGRMNMNRQQALAEMTRLGIDVTDLPPTDDVNATADLPGAHTGPLEKLESLANALRQKDPSLTHAQAFAKVYVDPRHRDLVRAEYSERMAKFGR
jgi:hypothetical protein